MRVVAGAAASDWLPRMMRAADGHGVDSPTIDALRAMVEAAHSSSLVPN